MNYFTARDIAIKLNVSEETVRRWIRTGKLEAEKEENEKSHRVSEESLNEFIKKYAKKINSNFATGASLGGILGGATSTLGIAGISALAGLAALPISVAGISILAYNKLKKDKKSNFNIVEEDKEELKNFEGKLQFTIVSLELALEAINDQIKNLDEYEKNNDINNQNVHNDINSRKEELNYSKFLLENELEQKKIEIEEIKRTLKSLGL